MPKRKKIIRGLFLLGAILGLLWVYLYQRTNFAQWILPPLGIDLSDWSKLNYFLFNKSIRFIANDFFAIFLIYALFYERKYVVFAFLVQLMGILFILLPYFLIKTQAPGYDGPLVNFLHRLILNPILIFILVPAFYLQKKAAIKPRH